MKTNSVHIFSKENNTMKKTLFVAILAVALVMCFASLAVARPGGQIYKPWTTSIGTPHSGYTSATTKCAVCHSVHYAAVSGATWTQTGNTWTASNDNTEMLLRSNVANSCNYCHIDTNIGSIRLYGGAPVYYNTSSNAAHNFAGCSECHSVHGAQTYQGANTAKILRQLPDGNPIQPEVISAASPGITPLYASAAAAYADTDKYNQQVAFCSSCHREYTTASDATITSGAYYGDPQAEPYKGHAMTNNLTVTNGTAPLGNTLVTGTQIAWEGSSQCRSCHDAGNVDETGVVTFNNFPHYTQGYYRFMVSAGSSSDATEAADAAPVARDGQCVKCHKADATTGVGQTY